MRSETDASLSLMYFTIERLSDAFMYGHWDSWDCDLLEDCLTIAVKHKGSNLYQNVITSVNSYIESAQEDLESKTEEELRALEKVVQLMSSLETKSETRL